MNEGHDRQVPGVPVMLGIIFGLVGTVAFLVWGVIEFFTFLMRVL